MDKFDLKKYLTEGKILKEDTTKYKPFVEGETVLIKSEVYNERRDYAYILESQEEYDFLVDTSVGEFLNAYPEVEVDAFIKDSRMDERTEYSLGNDMDSYDLTPISENKSTTQLKENTSKFPEYEEGKTFLERNEFLKTHNRYLLGLSKEEYDFYVENGEDVFFDKYPDATGNFEFVERPKEYMYEESEFKIVIDDEDYIDENKSTNQIKENTSKFPEYEEGASYNLTRTEGWMNVEVAPIPIDTKEEYDFLVKNGLQAYLDEYEEEFENYVELTKQYKTENSSIGLVKYNQGRSDVIMDEDDLY